MKEDMSELKKRALAIVDIYSDLNKITEREASILREAITADRPQGEWKVNNYGDVYCSNCGIMALCKEFTADDFREVKTDYCAFCGADMRGKKNDDIL